MNLKFGVQDNSAPMCRASAAARSISILYNNSRVYGVKHPVFRKTLSEHMPFFQDALTDSDELLFTFVKGKVHCGSLLLEPGSNVFQSLSHTMEGMGVYGFSIRRGVDAEEITSFITILTSSAADIAQAGLQSFLDNEKVRHIVEQKVVAGAGEKHASAEKPAIKKTMGDVRARKRSSVKTFDLEDTAVELDIGRESEDQDRDGTGQFKAFVRSSLSGLAWKKTDVMRAAERISEEFEERLNEKTTELRREKEVALRRLENVKNVVFEKLEALGIMAILVETDLTVLAMTSAARSLLGNINRIPPDTPLARCVVTKAAYMDINLAGKSITVQTIASDSAVSGETILLLTLNPE